MISKIHNIRGVGRFKDFESREGIELGKLTLIYSENGQGKSTLADILRSLSEGDERRLLGRKTVDATDQFIKFDTTDGIRCLHNGSWHGSCSDILIFDEIFINDNIYEGLSVRPEQREKLHPVIVGEVQKRGVQKEEELVEERKSLNASHSAIEKRIESIIRNAVSRSDLQLTVQQFVELEHLDDIHARIANQKVIVDKLKYSHRINSGGKFKIINTLLIPLDEIRALLNKKLGGIADDAKEALDTHVDRYSGSEIRGWLSRGTQYARESHEICPYCGQSLKDSHLIEHYQAIFEKTYEAFETEVSTFSSRKLDFASWIANVRSNHELNQASITFWAEHIPDLEIPSLDVDLVGQVLTQVKAEIDELLAVKKNTLFKAVEESPALGEALSRWTEVWKSIENYCNANKRYQYVH